MPKDNDDTLAEFLAIVRAVYGPNGQKAREILREAGFQPMLDKLDRNNE